MDKSSIVQLLSSLTVGTVIAWISVIFGIIGAFCYATVKTYQIFLKYKKMQDETIGYRQLVEKNDKDIKEMDEKFSQVIQKVTDSIIDMNNSLKVQQEVNFKQMKHSIVRAAEEALAAGHITISQLKSIEELYSDYIEIFHGNGYVKTLMEKVRQLSVIGSEEN